ncbi:MAG: NAD(P)/FAD-dependent oxidoreductase [Thermodesulfobacteriota bacterium]
MKKTLILAGSGHAHLATIAESEKFISLGVKLIIISEDDFLYYSGMAPGFLGDIYNKDEIRFNVKSIAEKKGAEFIKAKITKCIPKEKKIITSDGKTLNYDCISFNTGSVSDSDFYLNSKNIYKTKPIKQIDLLKEKIIKTGIKKNFKIGVIGGGAAGTELAIACSDLIKKRVKKKDFYINIFTGDNILPGFNKKLKDEVLKKLKKYKINIINQFVKKAENSLIYTDSKAYRTDIIIVSSGTRPSDIYENSALSINDHSGLAVNKYLQSLSYPDIFGGGDCIYFTDNPLAKKGVYAVKHGEVLKNNLLEYFTNKNYKIYLPKSDYMQILNTGNKSGVLYKNKLVIQGKIPFYIKNYIDTKFMKKYKSFE